MAALSTSPCTTRLRPASAEPSRDIQADMLKIPALLADAQKVPETKPADKPQQLVLL